MSMNDLDQAIQLIEENEAIADFEGHKSEDLIKSAEDALGLPLPPTYREFVRRLGCGDIAGEEFYGIIADDFENSSVPNGIWLTLSERKRGRLPRSLVTMELEGGMQ